MQKGMLRRVVEAIEDGKLSPGFAWTFRIETDLILLMGEAVDASAHEMAELTDLVKRYERMKLQ